MAVKVTIHELGKGTCALSGEQADGMTVSLPGFKEVFLSQEMFVRVVQAKLGNAPVKPVQTPRVAAS